MIIKEKQANLILLMLESEVSRKIRNEWRQISWSFSAFNTENVWNNNITTPGLKLLVFVTRIFASMGEITCDGQASITSCYRNSDKFCWMGLLFQNLTSYFFCHFLSSMQDVFWWFHHIFSQTGNLPLGPRQC